LENCDNEFQQPNHFDSPKILSADEGTPKLPLLGISFPMHNAGTEWGILSFTHRVCDHKMTKETQIGLGALFGLHLQEALRRLVLAAIMQGC
jgi:hypothetical protein